jgi:hypothetical protein
MGKDSGIGGELSAPTWETLEAFAQAKVQALVQALLEGEVTELLGRAKRCGGRRWITRNGADLAGADDRGAAVPWTPCSAVTHRGRGRSAVRPCRIGMWPPDPDFHTH